MDEEKPTQVSTINRAAYLQLLGLMYLTEKHNRILDDIEATICDLVGVIKQNPTGNTDWVSDAMWDTGTPESRVEQLLSRLDIEHEAPAAASSCPDAPADRPAATEG